MSFLDRVAACNLADLRQYVPFRTDERCVGWLRPGFAQRLASWPEFFELNHDQVRLHDGLRGFEQRSQAMAEVIHALIEEGAIGHDLDELYPVTPGERSEVLFLMDRGSVAHFGIRAFGQHLNGYVRRRDGLYMWIARRAQDRRHAPGKLDNLVAGGLPWKISLQENLLKECREEAGMSADLAQQAVAVGSVSYLAESPHGLKPDVMYCYDLELPDGFEPVCTDGEVESFELMPIEQVAEIVRETEDFKANCNLVIIDFLIRHGLLDPEADDYTRLVNGLHRPLP
jgi:isopentenyldiphosphate isomerase